MSYQENSQRLFFVRYVGDCEGKSIRGVIEMSHEKIDRHIIIEEWYQELKCALDDGKVMTAFGGDDERNGEVLMDFYEYIYEVYEEDLPSWAHTYIQVYSWQFQAFHEGVQTYYENFYEDNDYASIMKAADYLRENDYREIYEIFVSAAVNCDQGNYPKEKSDLLWKVQEWIDDEEHVETVWHFYIDILEKNKTELLRATNSGKSLKDTNNKMEGNHD